MRPTFTAPLWLDLIRRHNARLIRQQDAPKYPESAIAFETQNFGWILSAVDASGHRQILEQF